MHSTQIFAFPELVCYIVSFLPTAHDRSHLSLCCSYMHELVLPLLYEHVAISFRSLSVIVAQLIARPYLARRCHTLWVKDPHYSEEIDYTTFLSSCSDLGSLLGILSKHGRLKSFVWHMPNVYASSLYDPVIVWDSLRCVARGLETIDIFAPYTPNFPLGSTMLKGDYSTLRSLHLRLQYDQWHGTTLAENIKNMQGLEELYLDGIDESMALSFALPQLRLLSLSSGALFSTQGIAELCADLPKLRGLSMRGLRPSASFVHHGRGTLTHLRLGPIDHFLPLVQILQGVTSHLRCLEIYLSPSSLNDFLKILPEILQSTPSLVELGIYAWSQWAPRIFSRFWTWHRIELVSSSLEHALSLGALSLPDWDKNTVHLSTTIMDSSKNWPPQLRFIVCDKGRPSLDCVNVLDGRAMGVKTFQRAPADYNWTKNTIIDHATGMFQMLPC